jgi:2'-5' RNA ligase
MSRYFFALNPDRQTRKKIIAVQAGSEIDVRRQVPAENLHLTLLFLGQVQEENYSKLIDICNCIAVPRFSLQISRSGCWKRSQIAWLAPHPVPKSLYQLVNLLADAAKQCEIPVVNRSYRAHITLARKLRSYQHFGFTPIHWEVTEFCLFDSRPVPGGVEYQLMHSWPLS